MTSRTFTILAVGLPVTLATGAVVLAQVQPTSTTAVKATLPDLPIVTSNTSTSGSDQVTVPTVTINGRNVTVKPNSTTHIDDGTTQATISSSNTPDSQTITTTTNDGSTVTVDNSKSGTGRVFSSGTDSVYASGSGSSSIHISSSSTVTSH